MNLVRARGFTAEATFFRHPLYQGFWCFAGQLLAWPARRRLPVERLEAVGFSPIPPACDGADDAGPSERRIAYLCLLPTLCDVLGTVLNNAGLILTHLSIYQMLRGSVVLFTSLFSHLFLGAEVTAAQAHGLALVAAAILVLALANTLFHVDQGPPTDYAPYPALGNVLVLLSQALMGVLFVAEEKLLKGVKVAPLHLIAWEGTIGVGLSALLLLLAWCLPGDDAGSLENAPHATLQMAGSPTLVGLVATMSLSLLLFNTAGVYITKLQSATHRACIDATRQVRPRVTLSHSTCGRPRWHSLFPREVV